MARRHVSVSSVIGTDTFVDAGDDAGFLPKSATVVTGCEFGRKGMLTGEARVDGVGSRTWVHPVKKKNIWRWPAEYALSRTTWNAYGAVGTPDT